MRNCKNVQKFLYIFLCLNFKWIKFDTKLLIKLVEYTFFIRPSEAEKLRNREGLRADWVSMEIFSFICTFCIRKLGFDILIKTLLRNQILLIKLSYTTFLNFAVFGNFRAKFKENLQIYYVS